MAYTDFIAAIDLGSSHMVGMVGTKGPTAVAALYRPYRSPDIGYRRGGDGRGHQRPV